MAVRRRPSYGFDLAGTSLGVRPEAGVSRSTLAQLFPELNLRADAVTTGGVEEIEKPDDVKFDTSAPDSVISDILGDERVPGSEFQKYNLKGSLSYAAPFNVQVGPTGPQGRGSRLGYSGVVEKKPESVISQLVEKQKDSISKLPSTLGVLTDYFNYAKYGGAGFGLKDVEALRSQGVEEETLKELASKAPMVGPGAAQQLGYTPSQQQRTEAVAQGYDPASAGGAGFGLKDVEALRSQGVSEDQMRAIARRSPMIGEGARQLLGI